jgi:hypothetical protein
MDPRMEGWRAQAQRLGDAVHWQHIAQPKAAIALLSNEYSLNQRWLGLRYDAIRGRGKGA